MLKVTGLDELQRKLNAIGRRAEKLSKTQGVPLPELLTPDFLRRYSRFQSAIEKFEASGYKAETAEDFAAVPDDEWDQFVRTNTSFVSWHAMLGKAGRAWAAREPTC